MLFYRLLIALIAVYGALAAVNGRCSSGNGVCISTSSCTKAGGTYVNGKCPNDAADIKCCNKNSCTVNGKTGTCKFTSDCNGTSYAGACPGPSNFKCCVENVTKCTYEGLTGTCMNKNSCNGFRVTGLCPGNADNQCCLPKNSCTANGKSGSCIPTGQCSGTSVSGKCPGGKNIQCCVSSGGGSVTGQQIVDFAMQFRGTPYLYGGESPATGFDCSGFTKYVYAHFGYNIPRNSGAQATAGRAVSKNNLQPGDLVCYSGHVAIYIGNNQVIHSQKDEANLPDQRYYHPRRCYHRS